MPLTVVLKDLGRRCVALTMSGELDGDSQSDLARAHDQAIAGDPDTLVLDLAGVGHLDGDGVGLLTALAVRARQGGRVVRAIGLSQAHREMLALASLEPSGPGEVEAVPRARAGPGGNEAAPPAGAGPSDRLVS